MVVKAASSPGGPPVEQLPLNSAPPVLARSARWHVWEHLDPVNEIAEHEGRVPERHTEDGHPPRLTCSRSIFRTQALSRRISLPDGCVGAESRSAEPVGGCPCHFVRGRAEGARD